MHHCVPGLRTASRLGQRFDAVLVEVPYKELSDAALAGVVESFVLREGTDYGHRDVDFEEKCRSVKRQLEKGSAAIVYDSVTDSINIVVKGAEGSVKGAEGSKKPGANPKR